jgi:hypothetical protein
MKRLSDWLYKVSTGWIVILSLLISLVFTAVVLPRQTADAARFSKGVGSPDLSLFYSPDELYRMAQTYGEEGRDYFIRVRWTLDVIWPVLYTVFLCTAISWLFKKAITTQSWLWRTNLVPLLAGILDLLENSANSIVMYRYPAQTPIAATLAPLFTLLKWISVSASFILLLIGLLLLALNWISNKTSG